MNLKNSLKNLLYKSNLIYSTRWQMKELKKIFAHAKRVKNINKTKKDHSKPRIVFFLQYPETWNSFQTVYEAAVEDGAECVVLCVAKPCVNSEGFVGGLQEENDAYAFIASIGVHAIDGGKDGGFDLEKFAPDYVFYSRPYNYEMPPSFSGKEVSKYCKVCQIDYGTDTGIDILDGETYINSDFLATTYFKFLNSERFISLYKKKFALQLLLGSVHYKWLGYPRFDLLKTTTEESCSSSVTTIAWIPRWKIDKDQQNNYSSHFLDYVRNFLDFMDRHQELNLIIRPHPLMFADILNKGFLSIESLDGLIAEITARSNIILDTDKDYMKTLQLADLLIADFSSLIVEYYVSGKPIIYCNEIPEHVHPSMQGMYSSLYYGDNWKEIEGFILSVADGNDYKSLERQKFIGEIMPGNVGDIGRSIYGCVAEDFAKYNC